MQLASVAVSSILAVALLPAVVLADAKTTYPAQPVVHEGDVALFRSTPYGQYIAIYLDEGHFDQHENRGLIRRPSCFGGDFRLCDDGERCAELDGRYFMAPPSNQTAWRRGVYDLELTSGSLAGGDAVITASGLYGDRYAYGYSAACGVTWIDFTGSGEEVFRAEGRSLFWTEACTDGRSIVPTK